jgi:1-acyl-sn-glycerol-3-phosphate acyltransferase
VDVVHLVSQDARLCVIRSRANGMTEDGAAETEPHMSDATDAGSPVVVEPRRNGRAGASDESAGLEELRAALRGLREGIEARSAEFPPARPRAARENAPAIPSFDYARQRVGTFGMSERSAEVDDFGVDAGTLQRVRPLLDFLQDRFWRVSLAGLHRLPEGPALLVANRSGPLPWDGVLLAHAIARERPSSPGPRFLVEESLIRLQFVQPALAKIGGVLACAENADRLLRRGHTVIAFPEGHAGASKLFAERYRLKPFVDDDVIRVAIENGTPLVPVGIVGAEEANPVLFRPRAPGLGEELPPVPVTPTFPWLGPLGLVPIPTKWVVEIGDRLDDEELPAAALLDAPALDRVSRTLRSRVQRLVDRGFERRASVWER